MKKAVKKGSPQARSFAQKKEDERMLWTVKAVAWTQQEMLDAVSLVLNEAFGFGEERLKRFHDAFDVKYAEIRELDNKNDDDYFVAVIEKALAKAWGRNYQTRQERYSFKFLFNGKEIQI